MKFLISQVKSIR